MCNWRKGHSSRQLRATGFSVGLDVGMRRRWRSSIISEKRRKARHTAANGAKQTPQHRKQAQRAVRKGIIGGVDEMEGLDT